MSQDFAYPPASGKNPRQVYDEILRSRMQVSPDSLTVAFCESNRDAQEALAWPELQGRILDFGCGTGELDILLARQGREVVGYDVSTVAIEVAGRHRFAEPDAVQQRANFVLGEGGVLPFPDQSFDAVLSHHVFESIPHLTPVLKELARVLKPGGSLVAAVSSGTVNYDITRANFFDAKTLEYQLTDFFEEVEVVELSDGARLKAVCRNLSATRHPRIVCMMRIRNEERWIKEVMDSIARVADGIVIVDDGSTDNTPMICRFHPAVVDYHWQDEAQTDQRRDKQLCLKMALAQNPDWILGLDADEALESSAAPRIFEAICHCPPEVSILKIVSLFMWNDLNHYRNDGVYKRICQERLFRVAGQDPETLQYLPTKFKGNGHCTRLPAGIHGEEREIDVNILHLGYMYPEVRARRYEYYRNRDPKEFANGDYDHLIDQPHQTIETWRERPYPQKQKSKPAVASSAAKPVIAAGVKQEFKPDYYYANARRNLVELVPHSARRVLDVGCGHGMTGGLLRSERGIEVIGLEIHPQTAEIARQHLTEVVVGDLEQMDLPFEQGYFDCMIMGDVLEHLTNPWIALKKLSGYLSDQGLIVASIPNIRNLGIIDKLLKGSWTYEEWGILDKTHLRFFALKNMHELFASAGIDARVVETVRDPLFENEMKTPPDRAADVDLGTMLLRSVTPDDLNEYTAQQFIFTGTKIAVAPAPSPRKQVTPRPEVSVIIPVFNNVEYTRKCVTSLFMAKEAVDFEVIVVDNGSTDGTADYLRQLPPPVRAVSMGANAGFAKGCNAGAQAARGRCVVFLNNDTIVQPQWLSAMLECMRHDPTIGLVGNLQIYPDSGKVQQAGIVCGADRMLYSIYNNELPAEHPAVNKPREFQFVAGSCMLLEKDFFDRLGGFDDSYLNSCEDVDLCLKVRAAGRKVFYCPQSRIFHYESRTVSGHDKNGENYLRFLQRWGDTLVRDDQLYLQEDGFLPAVPAEPVRRSKKVVLVAPPRYFKEAHLSSYTGFSKNMGLAYVASSLRASGADVSIVDSFAQGVDHFEAVDLPNGRVYRCGLSYEETAARIPPDVDFIGVNIPFTNIARIGFELTAFLKSRFPRAAIVLGGVHPSAFPEESMRDGVDFVIRGEGELSMTALVRGADYAAIPGLVWRDESGEICQGKEAARVADLDALPFPAWDLLPMELYLKASQRGDRRHRSLSMITSRGCPFGCRFCSVHPVSGRHWRARSPENVLAEIRLARDQYQIDHIEFEDDNFTLNKERAMAILSGLRDISPDLTWSAHNGVRIDTLDEELLLAIKTSRCLQLNIAVEHGSPAVLKAMNKRLSLEKVREIVAACGTLRIPAVGFCLVGYPGETAEAFRESALFFQQLKQLGLTTIAPFIVNAYPGTDLYHEAEQQGWLNPATDRQLFFLEDEFVSITTPDFDESTVRMRKQAMEYLNENPGVEIDALLAHIPAPAPTEPKNDLTIRSDAMDSFPNVAILTTYSQRCGLATYAEYLVKALRESGVDPLILAEKTAEVRGPDESRVVRCWNRQTDGGGEILNILLANQIQVLHINFGGIFDVEGWLPNLMPSIRNAGIRIVTTFHATETILLMLGLVARRSDRVLVHHPQNKMELIALNAVADRIECIPHGMPKVERKDIFEAKLEVGWDPEQKTVGTFGFIEPHKGILEIIPAFRLSNKESGAHLHVLGGPHPANPESSVYVESCKQKARECGLEDAVIFNDSFLPEDELLRRLRACDILVMNYLSSRYEASGATMLALSAGRPIISSSTPPFEYESPLTFKTTTSFHLEAMMALMLKNPFVGRELLNNVLAYEKVAGWNVVAGRIGDIYRSVCREPQLSDTDPMQYYATHPDDIYAEALQRERVRWLRDRAEGRILEIGPANGYVSEFVGGSAAVDINRGRLEVAAILRPTVKFQFGNVVQGLPFKDKEFDQVLAPEILEHVDFDLAVKALRECARVGKRVLMTIPNADKPDYNPDLVHNPEHRWLVNRTAVDRLLQEAGCVDYELSVSDALDFYLLDIRTEATTPRVRVQERAALLAAQALDLDIDLHIGVDSTALEDATSRFRGIGRYTHDHFAELIRQRPRWKFTWFGTRAAPESQELQELCALPNVSYSRWQNFPDIDPEVLYVTHPMSNVGMQVLQSAEPTPVFVATSFYDLVPLLMKDIYLTTNPAFANEYYAQLRLLQRRCDLFFCISQCTTQDLQGHLAIPLAKLRTIHGGIVPTFEQTPSPGSVAAYLERLGVKEKEFMLFVGVPDHRKNAAGMFLAMASVRKASKLDIPLVIAGEIPDSIVHSLEELALRCDLPLEAVIPTGIIDDSEMNILYHSANSLLFPSLYEGLGFPILEAMSAGLPVIAGNNSSQTEICGDAALLVEVRSVENIAHAITQLYFDPELRAEMSRRGFEQQKQFTWKKTAEKTAIYLAEAIAKRRLKAQTVPSRRVAEMIGA